MHVLASIAACTGGPASSGVAFAPQLRRKRWMGRCGMAAGCWLWLGVRYLAEAAAAPLRRRSDIPAAQQQPAPARPRARSSSWPKWLNSAPERVGGRHWRCAVIRAGPAAGHSGRPRPSAGAGTQVAHPRCGIGAGVARPLDLGPVHRPAHTARRDRLARALGLAHAIGGPRWASAPTWRFSAPCIRTGRRRPARWVLWSVLCSELHPASPRASNHQAQRRRAPGVAQAGLWAILQRCLGGAVPSLAKRRHVFLSASAR